MDPRQEALAEAYRRGIMKPEQKAAYEEAMRRGLVTPSLDRSMGRRALDNIDDGFQRSGAGQINRNVDPNQTGWGEFWQAPRIREGGLLDRGLDATLGSDRGYLRGTSSLTPAQESERDRRARYAARAEADPVANTGDAAAAIAGQLLGGGVSPENWVGPASGITRGGARYVAGQVVGRAAIGGGAAAATDVLLQANDIGSGVQDDYSVMQTAGAFVLGGTIGAGFDVLHSAVVRPVSDRVRAAYVDPVVTPDVPTVRAADGPEIGAPLVDEAPIVLPDFASVKPLERGAFAGARRAVDERGVPGAVADMFTGIWRGTQDRAAKLYAGGVDDLHPLIRLREEMVSQTEALTGAPVNLRPSEDPLKLSRGRYDVFNIGQMDILHGVHEYGTLKASTPALADTITAAGVRFQKAGGTVADGVDALGKYAAARRALGEWDRFDRGEIPNPPVRETRVEAEAFIARIDKEHPEFKALSDDLNQYAQGLLKKKLASGRLSQEAYDSALSARDFYAPLKRDMGKRASVGAGANKASGIQTFQGSDRDILNPAQVLAEESYRLAQMVRQNDLNLSIVKIAERLDRLMAAAGDEDGNAFVRKVDRPMEKVTIKPDDLKAAARQGTDLDSLFDDDIEVFRPGEINEAGRAILYVWRDGKREAFELQDPEWGGMVLDALTSMTKPQSDMLVNVIGAGTTFLSRTITRDPSFLVANFVRDAFSAWTLTDVVAPFEGVRGVAEEVMQADSSRLYNLAGGISGGESSQAVGSMLKTGDVTELARRFDWSPGGIKMRYASDLKGFLRLGADAYRATELTETGTRRQVFNKAFKRATKEGMAEYDALLEAAFTARDYADFGRHGSKVWAARKVITFLNPWAQGIDKLIRTAITDPASAIGRAHAFGGREAALKAILAPLFRQNLDALPVRKADKAALKLAVHTWTRMSIMGTFGLALSAMFHDDPDYQNANERNRATHWMIPVGGGNLFRIPKPFEAAFMSNVLERAFEATYGGDATAWNRMWTGLVELFAPPSDAPLINVVSGLATGVDPATGRSIIPEGTEQLPPDLQFEWWTSQMAHDLGGDLGIAPAKVDFFMKTMAGPFGAYAMAMSNATDPDRPSGSWIDMPVARRFLSPSFRGAQDKRDFFDRAGARTSELARAANGIALYEEQGNVAAAQAIFDDLDEPGRLFVTSQRGDPLTDRLNPLVRARAFGRQTGRMIGELHGGDVTDEGDPLPGMTAVQRQMVIDQLEKIAVAEMGNAMIATGQPGFSQRNLRDRAALWDELETMAPEVASEMERRLRRGSDAAYSYDVVMELWPEVESRIRGEGVTANLEDLGRQAKRRSGRRRAVERDDDPLATISFSLQ